MTSPTVPTAAVQRLSVRHETRYDHGVQAVLAHHVACLQPRTTARQWRRHWQLQIEPPPDEPPQAVCDVFGNGHHHFSHTGLQGRLSVVAQSEVEVLAATTLPGQGEPPDVPWEQVRGALAYRPGHAQRPEAEFVLASPLVDPRHPALTALAAPVLWPGRPLRQAAQDLMSRVHRGLAYRSAATDVATTAVQALQRGEGVCQDLAQVMLGALRSAGLAARYVSGYLLTEPPPGQPRLIGADASHAWIELWCPMVGWWALDPTNDCIVGTDHVLTAWGRDYTDVAPLRGIVTGAGAPPPQVSVSVLPV